MRQEIIGFTYDFIKEDTTYLLISREAAIHHNELDPIQVKMINATHIPKLLSLEIEEMNMNVKFRYNISALRMLNHSLRTTKLSINNYYNLLLHIISTLDDSKIYMLSEKNFIIHENFIFHGNDYSDIYLTYLPLKTMKEKELIHLQIRTLAINLISTIDDIKGNGLQELIDYMKNDYFLLSGLKLLLIQLINNKEQETKPSMEVSESQWVNLEENTGQSRQPSLIKRLFLRIINRKEAPFTDHLSGSYFDYNPIINETSSTYENLNHQENYQKPVDVTMLLHAPEDPMSASNNEVSIKKAYLQIRDGGEVLQINKDNYVIGRGPKGVGFLLDHFEVSRSHAEIVTIGAYYCVKDLGSKNGTFLNNKELIAYKVYQLTSGDIIKIINTELIFCESQ